MSEPTATTDSQTPAGTTPPRKASEFSFERTLVAVVYLAFTAFITIYGSAAVYRDTFRAGTTQNERCSDGIRRLHTEFARILTPQLAPSGEALSEPSPRALNALDDGLVGLRNRCVNEGPEGQAAWEALDRWRFHAHDLSRTTRTTLAPDVERALRYQSPPTASTGP